MMGQISTKLRDIEGGLLQYYCEGCKQAHMVRVGDGPHPRWSWNGDPERPVFSPSVLVTGRSLTPAGQLAWESWIDAGHPDPAQTFDAVDTVCHAFVGCNGAQPGEVIFLPDSTHALVGQIRPLPDLPDWMRDDDSDEQSDALEGKK